MIYCVRFSEVELYLNRCDYQRVGETDSHLLYLGTAGVITLHKPNLNGDVTEIEVHGAFDAAGLTPPDLETHWCD